MAKKADATNIWAWVNEDEERLIDKGGQYKAIVENYYDFWNTFNSDYVAAELAIMQALEAANATDELKWQLHLRHWRLQLWLRQRQINRALPEAVDLLSMATDQRLRDVPQRICAYHDVVECYIDMDPAGYYEEIVANSQHILAQLPKRHSCATCARSHLAHASAAAGKKDDAAYWLNQTKATMTEEPYAGLVNGFGDTSFLSGDLDDAERYYREARDLALKKQQRGIFITATLNLIRVHLAKNAIPQALDMLQNVQKNMKYQGSPADLAKLAEVEGRASAAMKESQQALAYLKRSAQLYYDLGCYRDAAQTALYAAEVAQNAQITPPTEILDLAAQAVGLLPPASQDVYQKLAEFGRQPTEPSVTSQKSENPSAEELEKKELSILQQLLQEHIEYRQYTDVCMTLYRLARWHSKNDEIRAAVDYLIADAAVERLLRMAVEDREDALKALRGLQKNLPAGTIEAALTAAENGPPSWLFPLFPQIPIAQWAWVIRAIVAEVANRPFVEPEPDASDAQSNFHEWLDYIASMSALVLRFYSRCESSDFATWIEALNDIAEEMEQQVEPDSADREGKLAVITLVQGLAALARGTSVEEVATSVQPPFDGIIKQIAQIAKQPVWFHPGSSPLDFLVEQVAQRAVRTLRRHDKNRSRRLQNLALRYKLMEIDLREQKSLVPMTDFLQALRSLVLLEGKQLPSLEHPLDKPFDTILLAIFDAGQATETEPTI